MADQHEVTVIVPKEYPSPEHAAAAVEDMLAEGMRLRGLAGRPVVQWVDSEGKLMAFHDGDGFWEVEIPAIEQVVEVHPNGSQP